MGPARQVLVVLLLLLGAIAATPSRAAPAPHVFTVSSNGGWTWFQDPRAISFQGRTFVGMVTNTGAVVVRKVTHSTGAVSIAVVAPAGSIPGWDDHSAPSMVITPSERLAVFWSGHNSVDVRYRLSGARLDLTTWSPVRHLAGSGLAFTGDQTPAGSCYTHVVYRPQDRRYYLFARSGPRRNLVMTTTRDLVSWTPRITVIRNDVYELEAQPYLKVAADPQGRIHLAVSESSPASSAAAVGRAGLHHMYLAGGLAGSFRRSDGTLIRTVADVKKQPLVPRHGTTVHNDEAEDGGMARLWDVSVGADGRPAIVFTVGKSYRWARWDADAGTWRRARVHYAPSGIRGIALAERDGSRVYYVSDAGSLIRARTSDEGATWSTTRISATSSARRPVTPAVVPYATASTSKPLLSSRVEVLWMQGRYSSFRDFDTWIKAYGTVG